MADESKGWYASLIDSIVAAVAKAAAPALVFWAGRKSVEDKQNKDRRDEADRQLELELDHSRRTGDLAERGRVRERFRDRDGEGGP